jgi:2-haloacid dehalogenase
MSGLIPIFDVGGVLLDFDAAYLYRKIFNDSAKMDEFFDNILTRPWWIENLDRGRPFADATAELAIEHPKYLNEILAADDRWPEMVGGTIDGSVQLLERLKKSGQKVYAITNFPQEKFYLARELWPFLNLFDGVVISGEEGQVKPEPEIYHILLERFGLTAEGCFFIDDSLPNVKIAEEIGMRGHHFTKPVKLRKHLEKLAIL